MTDSSENNTLESPQNVTEGTGNQSSSADTQVQNTRNFDAVGKETPSQERRRLRLKLNGEEKEFDEDEVINMAQKGHVADQRFQEAARMKRELQELVMAVKSDPARLFKELQLDPRQWAQTYLSQQIEEANMTPEEKQRRLEQQELNRFRSEQQKRAEEQKKQQFLVEKQKRQQELEQGLSDAIAKTDLPDDNQVRMQILLDAMKFIAADRSKAHFNGHQPSLTYEQAVKRARDGYTKGLNAMLRALAGDKIYDLLGEDNIKKIRSEDLKRVKRVPNNAPSPGTGVTPRNSDGKSTKQPERKVMTEREWSRRLREGK